MVIVLSSSIPYFLEKYLLFLTGKVAVLVALRDCSGGWRYFCLVGEIHKGFGDLRQEFQGLRADLRAAKTRAYALFVCPSYLEVCANN